ncbi:MAG: hypothetical protein COU31_00320 [Candidatus Magasanikbacteria bacterium CG10_big_fil_rev_8_21_14_0_10_40_10]|uniref:Dihydroorotate dehydrogenase (quinone) n=1 Tax=Candidatus Magasanikbacteria bacterium CG10_big_fil_rev_8_21_14_0_10_40_10 TaxID=1974648 RepID=A0A2M6W542_9BACT|nr:MAG: hypothetical protein COU31_00320 [Candidatus Magasanikbacteria bacterium CG10_big_fil_rev_8_21_14_0_10_40_10]
MFYKKIIRPIFFKFDPELIHDLALFFLKITSRITPLRRLIQKICLVDDERLATRIGKITLPNPIGLAAGFDKNITAPLAYKMLGFGWVEFGSITYEPQSGNPRPRLWRLPADKSLIVNYGLSNCGAIEARKRLEKIPNWARPFGVSIAPSNSASIQSMADDYLKSFLLLAPVADYITLNVSCPNVAKRDCFTQVSFIEELLTKISQIAKEKDIDKDIFLKIGPDLPKDELDKIVDLCIKYQLAGMVAVNLVKDRSGLPTIKSRIDQMNHPGGISGRLTAPISNQVIQHIRKRAQQRLKIIGAGGVFDADDYFDKIKAGADCVQMMTGWIYQGPMAVKKINYRQSALKQKELEQKQPDARRDRAVSWPFLPEKVFTIKDLIFEIYKAKDLFTKDWVSQAHQDIIKNIRRSYLRYGDIDLIDEYDEKAVVFFCRVLDQQNCLFEQGVEFFTSRFVPAHGEPHSTEDLDLFLCQNKTIHDWFKNTLLSREKNYLQNIITVSRNAGVSGCQLQNNENHEPAKLKHSALSFIFMNHVFASEYGGQYKYLTAVLRDEIFARYKDKIRDFFDHDLVFPRFNKLLGLDEHELKLKRERTVYKYPGYFLNSSQITSLIENLYQQEKLSYRTLSRYIKDFSPEIFFDKNASWRETVCRLKGLGRMFSQQGVLEFSDLTGEELRELIDNVVDDAPGLHAIRFEDWREQLNKIINSF